MLLLQFEPCGSFLGPVLQRITEKRSQVAVESRFGHLAHVGTRSLDPELGRLDTSKLLPGMMDRSLRLLGRGPTDFACW
ncbi:hypothetical protein ACIRQO_36760 [Streptomyces anulatus]